jgi:hypothetical protein
MKNQIINYLAFAVLGVLWLGFLAALILDREILTATWQVFRSWPLIAQAIVGLLTLPVVVGLWIWQTGWAIWLKVILVLGLAWVTLYTFFPRKAATKAATSAQ